jgi:Kelch motif
MAHTHTNHRFVWILTTVISLCLIACSGSSGGEAPKSVGASWTIKTTNHGLGVLQDQKLVAMTNGDLFVVGSQAVGNQFVPRLAKSTDGGVTWVQKTALPLPSLYRFAAASNGTHIIVTGGRTSDTSVGSASYTYNTDVYRYDPTREAWSVVAVSPFTPFSAIAVKEGHAMAFNGDASIFVTGGGANGNGLTFRVFESKDAGVTWLQKGKPDYETHFNMENHCLLANGATLYALGGGGNSTTSNTYVANLTYTLRSTDGGTTWSIMSTTMPETANFAGCALVGNNIYSTGGLNDINQTSNITRKSGNGGSNWTLDLNSTVLGPRFNHSMTVRNGKLMIFGGKTAGTPSDKLDVIEGIPF